jgi:nuclear transport factor 2 (NTF2) superfamily protein
MNSEYQALIRHAYNAFNARDIDGVLQLMNVDVQWPNGWEGGYVYGHDAVRDYWTRQWKEINPVVEPVSFSENDKHQLEVEVHQVAKDLNGNILFDGTVYHVYTFQNAKIQTMEIQKRD